jgi:hypothetical protein
MGRRLWFWWVLAGLVGYGVGGPLGVALGTPGYIIENGFMSISFGGILTGVLQWLVLRRRTVQAGWWVPASIAGAIVFGAVVFGGLAVDTGGTWITDVTWIVGAGLFAPVAALLQWRLVLRRHLAGGPGWWMLANLVGFFGGGFGSWPVSALFGLNGKEGGLDAVAVWTVFGAVCGALTGAALVGLSRRPAAAAGDK